MRTLFRRRLDEIYDSKVFFIAFLGGLAGIFLLRFFGRGFSDNSGVSGWDWAAIVFAVLVLALYLLLYIIISPNRSGSSIDRASDNIYYLGLLFTLASLAYSLTLLSQVDVKESSRNSGLVLSLLPDFGVALFSTICGIAGRIFLQQICNHPMDVETDAREELGIAMRELRETIGQVVANLNGLSTQTSVALTELNQTVAKTLEQSANQNRELVQGVGNDVSALSSQFQKQISAVTNFTEAFTIQFDEILGSTGKQFQEFSKIPQMLGDKFDDFRVQLTAATEQIKQTSVHQSQLAAEMLSSVGALNAAFSEAGLSRISGIVEDAEVKFSKINEKLAKNEQHLSVTLDGINTQVDVLNTASSTLGDYGKKIEASVQSIDDANNEYVEGLSRAAETLRNKTDQT